MMRRVHLAVAAFVAIALSACQTLPQIPYDRATAGDIKTINVPTPAMPQRPNVVLASTVGQSFGLIGALIDAGMQSSRESDFEAVIKAQNFSGKEAFFLHLDGALTSAGYTPQHHEVARERGGFLKEYKAPADPKGDAYFDIVMQYGYIAAGLSTPYRPYVYLNCKLVRVSDKAVLMQKSIFYNPLNGAPEQAVTIPPDPAYEFTDFDALKGDPERAVKGLDSAFAQVAGTIGTMLR